MAQENTATHLEKLPEIPLDWQIPDNVPTHRVTNALVQLTGDEFLLSFFEQRGPILITEEDREKAMHLKSAKALCVARICITPERMETFIRAFTKQYEFYQELKNKNTK